MALISLERAKRHLGLPKPAEVTDEDDDLSDKITQAEAIVLAYLEVAADAWTEVTVPGDVKAAVLVQLTELWRFRGDDPDRPASDGMLSPPIRAVLAMRKAPVVA